MGSEELAERVRRAFAPYRLVVAEPAAVAGLDIPAFSKDFLLHVGLPADEIVGYDFGLVRTLPPLIGWTPPEQSDPSKELTCVADATSLVMALDPAAGGIIRLVDVDRETPDSFVNSSVELLGGFLSELVLHWKRCAAGEARAASAAEAERWMNSVDPPAVDPSAGFWPTVLDELRVGLL